MIDKNYNPLNPMVGQVKQFLDEKKIPEEQVVPFLMSLGHRGLAGAVAGRMRLEKASEGLKSLQQGKNAAPPTVVQENERNAQQVQQQVQQAMAMRQPQMPQQMPPRGMYGGGIVSLAGGGGPIAFQTGGGITDEVFDWDTWNNAYKEAQRTGDTSKMAALKAWAEKNLPNFSRYAEKVAPTVTKYGTKLVRGAPAIGAATGFLRASQTDPESIQRTSRLAQLGLMDVDPSSKTKTGLASLTSVAESAIPFAGLFYDTPLDRAEAMTAAAKAPPVETTLSPEETTTAQRYNQIVRMYGANSKEAKDFEAMYRASKGDTPPNVESELAQIISQSAASEPTAGASAAGASAARPAGPRLPSVSTTAQETKALSDLRERLKGMEDVSKPEAREAAIDREIAARMKRYTDMGIMKPFDDAKANVQSRLKELDGIKDKNFYKAMAMMGFTMAGTRGSFFQALAAGGAAGLSAYETFEERRQATLDKLQDRMMNIDMGIANIKERAGAGAEARVDKLESERNRVQDQITNLQSAQETLAQTQSFQLAMSDREIAARANLQERQFAADAARDEARFGGLGKELEKEILKYRAIADSTAYKPEVRAAAKAKVEELYRERERATQAGSGSFQSAALKAGAGQIPGYNYPMVGAEQGNLEGWGDVTVR